jgi:mediator of RNA polymerase II transcription subunit 21
MDRLTELQSYIDDLARLFYTSIGAIQRDAPPANLGLLPKVEKKPKDGAPAASPSEPKPELTEEQLKELATHIVQTSKTIEQYIESMPGIEDTEQIQYEKFDELQRKNEELARQLKEKIKLVEGRLLLVREALKEMAEDQLSSK